MPVTVPAGGFLLVVKHPQAFLWRYSRVPPQIVLGPYDGKLSNAGESIELSMPGERDQDGEQHYIRIDRVNYSDGSHPEDYPRSLGSRSAGPGGPWPPPHPASPHA